ncbi:MAG: restriction endonuclease, partial [Ruminococcus sp.]
DISETRPQNDSKIDNYLSDYSDTEIKNNTIIYNETNMNNNKQSSSSDVNISNSELLLLKIDSMSTSGIYFEKVACMLLKANGFQNVRNTKASNDYGIDILAEKDDITYAIQCKCYSSSVGNKAVQEAYSGKGVYNCMVAVVLTNNKFTKQAIETAKATQVLLWDRTKLIEMINSLSEEHLKSLINDSLVSNNQ